MQQDYRYTNESVRFTGLFAMSVPQWTVPMHINAEDTVLLQFLDALNGLSSHLASSAKLPCKSVNMAFIADAAVIE